jgi:hypothetical protein
MKRLGITALLACILSGCAAGQATPDPSTTGEPSETESSTAGASAGATGAEPSAAAHAPVVPTPVGILPPDSVARVVGKGLRVRAGQPGSPDYDHVLYSLSVGDLVLIDWGPWSYLPPEASPDGRGWYEVHVGGASIDSMAAGGIDGWVAEGDDGLEWLAAEPVTCLGPATLALLLAPPDQEDRWTTGWERLACQGGGQLELEGVAEALCFEGTESPYTFAPFFLASPDRCAGIVLDDIDPDGNHSSLALDLRYQGDVAWPPRGDLLRLSGHFDDPASSTCTATASFEPSEVDPEFLVLFCRERFVVDEFVVIGHRDLAPPPWEQ